MKIVEIAINGIGLFEEKSFKMNLLNRTKIVLSEDGNDFYKIETSKYLPNTVAIFGNNASGKTISLKLIKYAMESLFSITKINSLSLSNFLKENCVNDTVKIELTLYRNNEFEKIQSIIKFDQETGKFKFSEEKSYMLSDYKKEKKIKKSNTSKIINEFLEFVIDDKIESFRSKINIEPITISDEISVFSYIEGYDIAIKDTISNTNINVIQPRDRVKKEWLNFLDPSISSIDKSFKDGRESYNIKFKNNESQKSIGLLETIDVISSGTAKSINIFPKIVEILKSGGYLLIDEIENHLNQTIIREILYIFKNKEMNKNNATLIFTTHYIEILDEIRRNDNIFYTYKKNNLLKISNLNNAMARTDMKKSAFYNYALGDVGIEAGVIKNFRNSFRGSDEK